MTKKFAPQPQPETNPETSPTNPKKSQTSPEPGGTGTKNCCPHKSKKGQRGFIEGCLFTLCCCWLCEACY